MMENSQVGFFLEDRRLKIFQYRLLASSDKYIEVQAAEGEQDYCMVTTESNVQVMSKYSAGFT